MRTNQVSQTIALAIGLVAAIGFLGYTMLGPRSEAGGVALPQQLSRVTVARAAPGPAVRDVPPAVVVIARPETIQLTREQARFIETGSLQGVARPAEIIAPAITPAPQPVARAPAQEVRNDPPPAKVPAAVAIPLPPAPVLSLANLPARETAVTATATPAKRKPIARQSAPRVNVPEAPRTQAVATAQWEEIKSAVPAVVEKLPQVVAATPVAPAVHKGATSVGISTPFSKDEMTVTISGDKAWVQVSPTQTMTARKGDVLPNLGKILEIKNNQVVAEKGILTTH